MANVPHETTRMCSAWRPHHAVFAAPLASRTLTSEEEEEGEKRSGFFEQKTRSQSKKHREREQMAK